MDAISVRINSKSGQNILKISNDLWWWFQKNGGTFVTNENLFAKKNAK